VTNLIEKIEELADDLGLELRTDYSGRGMYDRTCYGIVTDGSSAKFLMTVGKRDLPEPRQDSMGLRKIFYWPQASEDD
jgi:hypothetical protein